MAESARCGLDSINDRAPQDTVADINVHNRARAKHNNGSVDEDSDNECWDDARALLHNDCDDNCKDIPVDPHDLRSRNRALSPIHDTIDGSATVKPVSPSSVYSGSLSDNVNQTTSDDLILHEAVFCDDRERILSILNNAELVRRRGLVNKRDKHGNTALHLACMMGRSQDIISAHMHNQHGFKWAIDTKNLNRWTPFHEACSYGNRDVITLMAKQLKDDVDDALHNSKLSDFLEKTKDYRLVLKWEFQSWVPFVSRVLPSDVCVINKQGKYVRIDTRLLDFEGLFRKKGDSCLVYSERKWIVMNNKTKKYQHFEAPSVCRDIEDKVDEFMSTDLMDLELKSSEMQLTRSTSGWIWKADKVGKVGRFNAALYDLNHVFLVTRKRREHLSEDDLERNKSAYKSAVHMFKFGEKPNQQKEETQVDGSTDDGDQSQSEDDQQEIVHRESLPPPPPTLVLWQEYLQSEPGNHPTLGREQKCKIVKTPVKASVAMSEEFPLSKAEFLDLLSIVPIKLFKKLREFVEMKLPEGFPVRLDIPVFPFLTARITFEDFAFHDGPIDESLFTIPQDYVLDSNLLPDRFTANNHSTTSDTA